MKVIIHAPPSPDGVRRHRTLNGSNSSRLVVIYQVGSNACGDCPSTASSRFGKAQPLVRLRSTAMRSSLTPSSRTPTWNAPYALQVDVSCARSRFGSQVVAGKTWLKLSLEIAQPVQPVAGSLQVPGSTGPGCRPGADCASRSKRVVPRQFDRFVRAQRRSKLQPERSDAIATAVSSLPADALAAVLASALPRPKPRG